MDNLSEKDIDYIFQEGSKKHEFPFKESAWNNMEALLDKQDRRRNYGYASLILLGLCIASFAGYTIYNSNSITPTNTKENINKVTKPENIASASSATSTEINSKDITSKITSTKDHTEIDEPVSFNKNNTLTNNSTDIVSDNLGSNNFDANNLEVNNSRTEKNTLNNDITKTYSAPLNNKINTTDKQKVKANNFVANTISPSPYTEIKVSEINIKKEESNTTQGVLTERLSAAASLATLDVNKVLLDLNQELPSTKIIFNKPLSKFRFGIILSKEWSSVGMSSNMSGGFKIGGDIAYRLNNKIQLNTGFAFSKKEYKTEGYNYNPELTWVASVVPQTVTGTTNVFEIPLELNYFLQGTNRNSFYFAGGLTTYIMDKEWYDFSFENPLHTNDPSIPKFQNNINSKKSIHYFGIGTVSFGYQKQLNNNTALQLAPYIHIPLTGIGMGKVDLVTAGVQLKISFNK